MSAEPDAPTVLVPRDLLASGMFARCPLAQVNGGFAETTASWRQYAREAGLALQLALQVHRGNLGEPEFWGQLCGPQRLINLKTGEHNLLYEWQPHDLGDARFRLSSVVNRWLHASALRPTLWWGGSAPIVTWGNRTLFGYLASQLLLVVSRTHGLAKCTGCPRWFNQKRQLAPDRHPYCAKCGRRAALRHAAARRRAKQKQVREMRAAGTSIREIARAVHSREKTIRGWLATAGIA